MRTERLRYPCFGVRVRVVSSCFTDVCNSIILFLFSCNRQRFNAKNVHLNYEYSTDLDENTIANQNHATRTPKPGYLNLSNENCLSNKCNEALAVGVTIKYK